jgi:hypothetical protein
MSKENSTPLLVFLSVESEMRLIYKNILLGKEGRSKKEIDKLNLGS